MVRSPVIRVATWVAFLSISGVASLPIAASADAGSGASEFHYSTTITTVYGSQYPIAGHLDLEIFPAGNLRGYYHNAYQKAFIQVVGGRDGNYIWFDIGPSPVDLGLGIGSGERLHIIANFGADGSFKGQAFPQYISSLYPQVTASDISRAPASGMIVAPDDQGTAPQQYLFAAKPMEPSPEDYASPSP